MMGKGMVSSLSMRAGSKYQYMSASRNVVAEPTKLPSPGSVGSTQFRSSQYLKKI